MNLRVRRGRGAGGYAGGPGQTLTRSATVFAFGHGPLRHVDGDLGTLGDAVEEFGHVAVIHADAAVGGGLADEVFLVGAVDVDVPVEGIGVLWIKALEPQDSCEDEIRVLLVGIFGRPDGSGPVTFLEDGAAGEVGADFLRDAEATGRCAAASGLGADPESGCRDGVCLGEGIALPDLERLIGDANAEANIDHRPSIARGGDVRHRLVWKMVWARKAGDPGVKSLRLVAACLRRSGMHAVPQI